MNVDASAVLAILYVKAKQARFDEALAYSSSANPISAVNYWEVFARLDRAGTPERRADLDALLTASGISIASAHPEHAFAACEVQRLCGKGKHGARLNMGDCFADALAKARGEPLPFTGGDLRLTDVEAAL
jgi:ribonuclease VapC